MNLWTLQRFSELAKFVAGRTVLDGDGETRRRGRSVRWGGWDGEGSESGERGKKAWWSSVDEDGVLGLGVSGVTSHL